MTELLQSCCCSVQKYLPRMAELAWQLSRYLWRGSVNFKINSRPLFTIILKLKNYNFKTRDFSPLTERVLAGVGSFWQKDSLITYLAQLQILVISLYLNQVFKFTKWSLDIVVHFLSQIFFIENYLFAWLWVFCNKK